MGEQFPFEGTAPNMFSGAELDKRYAVLHATEERTHTTSDGTFVWHYEDVKEILEAKTAGLTKANSLDPLDGYAKIAMNPLAIPPFVRHLVPLPAKATANNIDHERHDKIWQAMAGPDGYFRIKETAEAEEAMVGHFNAAYELGRIAIENGRDIIDISGIVAPKFAASVMTEWVGLPLEEAGMVEIWSRSQSGLLGRHYTNWREQAEAVRGLGNLFTASKNLVRARLKDRTDDFPSHLLNAGVSPRDTVAALANSLAAGVFTVSGTIERASVDLLGPQRELYAQLADPDRLRKIGREALRRTPGLIMWKAGATQEVTLASGTTLQPGTIFAMIEAANRDPNVFTQPNDFLPDRKGAQPLTFGQSEHICPGQWIARLGLQVFLRELQQKAPEATLIPVRRSQPAPDLLFSGADVVIAA